MVFVSELQKFIWQCTVQGLIDWLKKNNATDSVCAAFYFIIRYSVTGEGSGGVTCSKGIQLEFKQGRCGYLVCILDCWHNRMLWCTSNLQYDTSRTLKWKHLPSDSKHLIADSLYLVMWRLYILLWLYLHFVPQIHSQNGTAVPLRGTLIAVY